MGRIRPDLQLDDRQPGRVPRSSWELPFDDPLVRASYKPYACEKLKIIVPNTAPPIARMRGANDYTKSLDNNLQKALTKQISPAQAMANTASAWDKTTNRYGRAKQVKAIKAGLAAWPTTYKYR